MKTLVAIAFLVPHVMFAQTEPAMKQKAFEMMVGTLLSHSVAEVKVSDVQLSGVIVLDAREQKEFDVSHLPRAQWVGYDDFDLSRVALIPKDAPVMVYCSVGYRSEKIAERLIKAGFTHVTNLYGGIFAWSNAGHQVVDSTDLATNRIHGYSRTWGIWLDSADVVY